jgi:hypothetical protein
MNTDLKKSSIELKQTKLEQAQNYHSKVLRLYKSEEYFDVLNNAQKCSSIFSLKGKPL